MDTAQAIILTTIFNVVFTGFVGGIVIYTIQKKIDATIQKSLFEHQTRFTISHAKSIAAIETLHQKFILFAHSCENMILARDTQRQRSVMENLWEFWQYFVDNRLFIPESFEGEIQKVFENAVILLGNASAKFSDKETSLLGFINELDAQTRRVENSISQYQKLDKRRQQSKMGIS